MSKRARDEDDDEDESGNNGLHIVGLSKERQKLLLARGVPGQDMIPRKSNIDVLENLVKMEPNIPRAMSKIIAPAKQMKKLNALFEHPLRSAYTLGIGSFPSDLRAKHLAITLMNAAIDEYIKKRPPGRAYPLWHRVYGGLGDGLRDRPVSEMPCMLIISNINMESSSIKVEKVRDLLEKYSEIPRIVITGGEPPVDFFANKLHYQMTAGCYIGPSNRVRET